MYTVRLPRDMALIVLLTDFNKRRMCISVQQSLKRWSILHASFSRNGASQPSESPMRSGHCPVNHILCRQRLDAYKHVEIVVPDVCGDPRGKRSLNDRQMYGRVTVSFLFF
jgi:hypothetical protein